MLSLLLVGVCPTGATAAPCPHDEELLVTAPGDDPVARIELLETTLHRGARRSRAWSLGWGLGLGALAIGQVAIAPTTPAAERPDWWVGAGASAVGALTRAVFLPRVFKERRHLARSSSTGCRRVAELEGALVRSGRWEREGRGLLMHGLSLGFNLGVGLVLGLGFDRPISGNRLGAMGAVIGEVMILTQPTYLDRTLAGEQVVRKIRWGARPWVGSGMGGVSLSGRL